MSGRWPCAGWCAHAGRTGASVSMEETPHRTGPATTALTIVVPALMANVAKPLDSRLPAGSARWRGLTT